MLPVITLASIAVALPNIAKHKGEQLLRSMGEGLSLVKIVEKTLDKNAQLVNIRKSADVTWTGVVLYMKWLDVDLRRTSRNCNNSKDLVRELSRKAEKAIVELKREEKDSVVENPRNWRTELVCWNSMYRISRTILLSFDDEDEDTDEELFERLSVMIADIFAACLTNLPQIESPGANTDFRRTLDHFESLHPFLGSPISDLSVGVPSGVFLQVKGDKLEEEATILQRRSYNPFVRGLDKSSLIPIQIRCIKWHRLWEKRVEA
ncbi:hypothetical protein ACS0TY_004704 [Phlomoides rotata]